MFDLDLEEQWYQQGVQDGRSAGNNNNSVYYDGYSRGVSFGVELSLELSIIRSQAISHLRRMEGEDTTNIKSRKRLKELLEKVEDFPKRNLPEIDFVHEIESIRSVSRSLNVLEISRSQKQQKSTTEW